MHLVPGLFYVFIFVISLTFAADSETQKEIREFDKILQEENSLVVLFTQACCACTDCVEAEVLLGGMSKELEENLGLLVVRLKAAALKNRYGIKKLPAMAYVRDNKTAIYDGKFEFDALYMWLQDNRLPATVDLDDSSFEHLTQAATGATTGDWLVAFHDGDCKNRELMHLETAGTMMRNKVNVASVDIRRAPETARRFQIHDSPEVIFFRHQRMYRFSLSDLTSKTLRGFAEGFYKNSKAERVPLPPSVFDRFTDKTIQFYNEYWYTMLVLLAITTVCTTLLLICAVIIPSPHKKSD